MNKPPEQTQNQNGFLYDINLIIYEIKMDINLIILQFVYYINEKICRIIRVLDMYRKSVKTNVYYLPIHKEGIYDGFSNPPGCGFNHIARFISQHKIICDIFFVL